ncbi:GtrA family protein [Sinimarinibacterium sp. NLF-5-8]|uniref:GtrA family protein n=1 Tax=Sinimarinibacterium sp. NLF-5-8 TaxID=2698684 RepID=UPI00137C0591|nr:GtrA family protein [Sinimarinibacterium sp. NLF-5-8]QHS11350.1 GtrA family protein [Sinimarinibacterium sp. NLF-5-8]
MHHRAQRFICVGVSAAALQWLLVWLLLRVLAIPFIAAITAHGLAFIYAYSLHHAWTFTGTHPHRRSLPRYLATQVICATLSGITAQVLSTAAAAPWLTAAAATVIASLCSYWLSARWAFAQPKTS